MALVINNSKDTMSFTFCIAFFYIFKVFHHCWNTRDCDRVPDFTDGKGTATWTKLSRTNQGTFEFLIGCDDEKRENQTIAQAHASFFIDIVHSKFDSQRR